MRPPLLNKQDTIKKYTLVSYDDMKMKKKELFDIDNPSDYMVFLHIQKTGGSTFGKHLVRDLGKCRCKTKVAPRFCKCLRKGKSNVAITTSTRKSVPRTHSVSRYASSNSIANEWLFSRYNVGWPCGAHAGWTQMLSSGCVDRRIRNRY